jgi:hypothetical protein
MDSSHFIGEKQMKSLTKYSKSLVAAIGAIMTWVPIVITSEPAAITAGEWYLGAAGVLIALGVYSVPNKENRG